MVSGAVGRGQRRSRRCSWKETSEGGHGYRVYFSGTGGLRGVGGTELSEREETGDRSE